MLILELVHTHTRDSFALSPCFVLPLQPYISVCFVQPPGLSQRRAFYEAGRSQSADVFAFVCKADSRKGSWHQPRMLQAWVRSDLGPGDVLSSVPGFGKNTGIALKRLHFVPGPG